MFSFSKFNSMQRIIQVVGAHIISAELIIKGIWV